MGIDERVNGELAAAGVDLSGWRGLVMERAASAACARRLIRAGAEVIVLDLDGEEPQTSRRRDRWPRHPGRPGPTRVVEVAPARALATGRSPKAKSAADPADNASPAKCLMLVSRLQVLGTCRGSTGPTRSLMPLRHLSGAAPGEREHDGQ
jgi:hypothetical protein